MATIPSPVASSNPASAGPLGRVGILVTNLGTPSAPTPRALRTYLKEFLWDPRVVPLPRLPWWLLLNGIILNVRPRKSALLYQRVWSDEGSPLMATTCYQTTGIKARLKERLGEHPPVAIAMRYGHPSIQEGMAELRSLGCERVLVFPLYPQYSSATTASTFDAVAQAVRSWKRLPDLRLVMDYHCDPGYIGALANSVREFQAEHGRPDRLLMSFHGLPQRFADEGDPYPVQCEATAHALAGALGLAEGEWALCYQSRFGREPWLQPYTDKTLERWPGEGIKRIQVICPGFSADCLETLEEIAMTNRETFIEAGGEAYDYIPALNARGDHTSALAEIAIHHMRDWLTEGLEARFGQSHSG